LIRDQSYGSIEEIEALVPYYATDSGKFGTTTRPTLAAVEKFVDRVSAVLNVLLAKAGFSIPVEQADARLAIDEFVVTWAQMYCHSANRAGPFSPERREVRQELSFRQLMEEAMAFVEGNALGLERLGATRTHKRGEGLYAGGISISNKDDFEQNTDRVIPAFTRDMQRPSELGRSQKLSAEEY